MSHTASMLVASPSPAVPTTTVWQPSPAAVLRLDPPSMDFRPKTERAGFPTLLSNVPKDLVEQFALIFNGSRRPDLANRWACVSGGNGLLLLPVDPELRPEDPYALHPEGEYFDTKDQAEAIAHAENRETRKFAHVPRKWSIVIVPVSRPAVEGGAA